MDARGLPHRWQPLGGRGLSRVQRQASSTHCRSGRPAHLMFHVIPKCNSRNLFSNKTLTWIKADFQFVHQAASFVYGSFETEDKTRNQKAAHEISEWITTFEMSITAFQIEVFNKCLSTEAGFQNKQFCRYYSG